MNPFLRTSTILDWAHPNVARQALQLAAGREDHDAIARACFEFVRDEIRHSYDHRLNPVTLTASETLEHRTGYCYAKSHLLAALLRANGIPAALCYQRLSLDGNGPPYSLHGLNAVYLPAHGWYRIDARGNKPGVNAQFCPPREQLAFSITLEQEADFPERWPDPLTPVIDALRTHRDWRALAHHLPDMARPRAD